jgi:hypothetical protein
MNDRELILLSPYRMPAQSPVMLSDEDIAAFLNGYAVLWHPAVVLGASQPPQVASPYDHEPPRASAIYAVPESPALMLADDWEDRAIRAGAMVIRSTGDRAPTFANMTKAVDAADQAGCASPRINGVSLSTLGQDRFKPFLGLGFGYLTVQALFEAMEHESVLAAEFWLEIRNAAQKALDPDAAQFRGHLLAAADYLRAAREVLYPAEIHLLDLCLGTNDAQLCSTISRAAPEAPANIMLSGQELEELERTDPALLDTLRSLIGPGSIEICGGSYVERADALCSVESQLWNLKKGLAASKRLTGADIQIHASKKFAFHALSPAFLSGVRLSRTLFLSFDSSSLPSFRSSLVSWPAPSGKQVEAFTRAPYRAASPSTFFHAAHYLHKTIMEDHAATVALVHAGEPAASSYEDWIELNKLCPALGKWATFSHYFDDALSGEQAAEFPADDFTGDYLPDEPARPGGHQVTQFSRAIRGRRQVDTAWTIAALNRALAGPESGEDVLKRLGDLEDRSETGENTDGELAQVLTELGQALSDRLLANAPGSQQGFLLINPCSFARRVPLEVDGVTAPLPITGPLKACQMEGPGAKLIVEVPALGYSWIPNHGLQGTLPMGSRMRLADERHVRNEYFEAEVDPATGGLRGLCDHRTQINRLGQQLVFNPGSSMKAQEVKVTSAGPALGEITSEGAILNENQEVLATFRQRFRAWLGRPVLDLRIEIFPRKLPDGYPWHQYYGCRFAWRDERALLLRGINGSGFITSQARPVTTDYLELRSAKQNTVIFPQGLPLHQRHGARMLDVLLLPPGESGTAFDIALGIDRENPMLTAWGLVSPLPCFNVAACPPRSGPSSWLFHLDRPNVILTSMRPAEAAAHAVIARFLECGSAGGLAEFRCFRTPKRACIEDARGENLHEAEIRGDAVVFDIAQSDLLQLRIDF